MNKNFFYIFLFFMCLKSSNAYGDACIYSDTSKELDVAVSCGFSLLPDMFKNTDVALSRGQKLCKGNRIGFFPVPCQVFITSKKKKSRCMLFLTKDEMTIKDDVFENLNLPFPEGSKNCRLHF